MGKKVTAANRTGGAEIRTLVLLGVLGVLCLAFGYDYFYAKPRAQEIHDAIFAYCDDSIAKAGAGEDNKPKLFTPADIHKMLGDKFNGGTEYKPSKVTAEPPGHIVETYSIMAGAVIKTYDVHVIYTANKPETAKDGRSEAKFSTVVLGEYPKEDLLPQGKTAEANNAPLPPPPTPGGTGSGGPRPGGGGPPGGPGGGGRRPGGESATSSGSEEKKEGEKKEEEKKEEGKKEETKPEAAPSETKPEGEKKEETEKKEEAKPEPPPAEAKPEAEKKEEAKPTPPAETPPAETPAKPAGEPKGEDKPAEPKN